MEENKPAVKFFGFCLVILGLFFYFSASLAAEPTTGNWFQLLASPYTGGDDSGDGGGGGVGDYNYFYVGQTFTANIQVKSENTNAANIWIDYDATLLTASNQTTGTYFSSWSGQTIAAGRVKSTGFRLTGLSSGTSTDAGFGSVDFTALKPTAAGYGTGAADTLDINIGVVGATTESNISYLGNDILQEAEDFNYHIWADTKAPYAKSPSPANGASGVTVESDFTFELRDSKNGTGDDTGVGTGVNTAMPHGAIAVSNHTATSSYAGYASFSCSGTWGANLCNTTLSPASPSAIAGDNRRWQYATEYIVQLSGFRDYASASQDQLGDANGPNVLATTTFSFTTEADTTKPAAANKTPDSGDTGVSVSANIVFDILDKKAANVSGSGVDAATCAITVQSLTFASTTYQQGSAEVTVAAIDYGYRFTINPATNFSQNDTVTVNIHDCQDTAATPNIMVTDIYTFTTADSDAPYVEDLTPVNDATIATDGTVAFHLKDAGAGSSLASTVVYVNGTYYTAAGGAGTISINGKNIAYVASAFAVTATSTVNDYAITVTPAVSFTAGEAVPVIIFAQDTSGNVMDYGVYAYVVAGGTGGSGSSYCGANTSWDAVLAKCVGTGGGSCSVADGGGTTNTVVIYAQNALATQINASSVLITWYSNLPGTSRVVYGPASPAAAGTAPNYNYPFSTPEINADSVYHTVVVSGLKAGQVYYFRPVTKAYGNELRGPELTMAPRFGADTCPTLTCPQTACPVCPPAPLCPVSYPASGIKPSSGGVSGPAITGGQGEGEAEASLQQRAANLLKILNIRFARLLEQPQRVIIINGTAMPQAGLKLRIY